MGQRRIKRRGRVQPPSMLFMLALAIGVILVMILFALAVKNPARPVPPKKKAAAMSVPQTHAGNVTRVA